LEKEGFGEERRKFGQGEVRRKRWAFLAGKGNGGVFGWNPVGQRKKGGKNTWFFKKGYEKKGSSRKVPQKKLGGFSLKEEVYWKRFPFKNVFGTTFVLIVLKG